MRVEKSRGNRRIFPKKFAASFVVRNSYLVNNKCLFMFSVFRILSVRLHSEPALNIVEGINCAEGFETQIYAVFSQSETCAE